MVEVEEGDLEEARRKEDKEEIVGVIFSRGKQQEPNLLNYSNFFMIRCFPFRVVELMNCN